MNSMRRRSGALICALMLACSRTPLDDPNGVDASTEGTDGATDAGTDATTDSGADGTTEAMSDAASDAMADAGCLETCPLSAPDCCEGACVNTFTQIDNCGTCGHKCPDDARACHKGVCGRPCATVDNCAADVRSACCGGACIDLTQSSTCGTDCDNIAVCLAGQSCCGACVDEQTDFYNCGRCGNWCGGAAPACCAGTCNIPAGSFGNWCEGRTESWCSIERNAQTPEQQKHFATQLLSGTGLAFRKLRSLFGTMDEALLSVAGRAFQISNWARARTGFAVPAPRPRCTWLVSAV